MIFYSLRVLCLILTFLWLSPLAYAQKRARATEAVLPLDPTVRRGTLPNGFTYYIQRNTEPVSRVQLYLVVKAGSILEEDDQRGLAHYLEHMAFNGTKHFPKNELINYLQKNGVRFGADLNAYTSFNETVYQLPLPADDASVLQNGFQIMRDWAQGALLEQAELDKERGVILEEKRMGKGLRDRVREQTLPVMLNHSRYANRLPIGTEEVLNTFTRPRIASFYEDWYRPDLEALIVVGDVVVEDVEKQIRTLFGDLKEPRKKRNRATYTIPLTGTNQYLAVTDAEQSYTSLQLTIKHTGKITKTVADLRRELTTTLFNDVVAERLADLSRQDAPPFLRASVDIGAFFENLDALSLVVIPKPQELEAAFKQVYTELVRYQQHGVSAAALQRAKARYQAAHNAEYNERDKMPSSDLVERYVAHFTTGAASPGMEYQHAFLTNHLDAIGVADLNALVREYFTTVNRDIILTAPASERATLPDEATLERWMAEFAATRPAPLTETEAGRVLLEHKPAAGKVVERRVNSAVGITELTLSNGVKVVLKPTTFKNDEILIQGFSPGGTSLYNNRDFMSAAVAADLVAGSGVGNISPQLLMKVLSGKQAVAKPFISERFEGIGAAATKADLETALQLVYLYITSPREDSILFKTFLKRQEAGLQSHHSDPGTIFADTINAVLGAHHYRRTAMSLAKLNTISLDRASAIYRERFANAGDFTFVVVGSFTVEAIVPLLEQYLGSLPATQRREAAADLGIRIPKGNLVQKVYKGREDKASVRLVYSGPHTYNQFNNLQLDGLKEVLQLRLTERLREEEGGVYSPSVSVGYTKYPVQAYTLTVAFDCAPTNVDRLVKATQQEIFALKTKGVRAEDTQKYLVARKRQWETMQQDNEFWYSFLSNVYMENESPDKVLTYTDALDGITPVTLQQATKGYFDEKDMMEFVLLPETMQQP